MQWNVTTPPAGRVVSWEQARDHLRLDSTDEKPYVLELIDAATEAAGEMLGASLLRQGITAVFYPRDPLILPRGPVVSVQSVTDDDGRELAAGDDYRLERRGHTDTLHVCGTYAAPLTVVYTAGYAQEAAGVPADVRHAIKTHVATLYAHREHVAAGQLAAVPGSLVDFYRRKCRDAGGV